MRLNIVQIISLSILLLLPVSGNGAELGTRQRTITPVALSTETPLLYPDDVAAYDIYGYSSWKWGPGEDEGQQFTNMPAGYTGATNAARLLSFLSISDAHITDKESPCQGIFAGYQAGAGDNPSPYSPVMLYTTQVLDAAIRTANAVNRLTPFDFAISLGDEANGPQYNELRWFIDVMDGKYIIPSSGTNAGAGTIDYQKPFQATGLDPAIPWYAVLGNHDHFWLGGLPMEFWKGETPHTVFPQSSFTNENVLLIGTNYMGTIDGSTPYGNVIDVGSVAHFVVGGVTNTPKVAADVNRYSLTTSNWMDEFFTTTSKPVGHGFSQANITNDFACYSFEPKTNMPIKVIVLDDTMTDKDFDSKGQAGLDANQLAWLVHELDKGQAQDQLMIVAAHEPIEDIALPGTTNSVISNTNMLALLHSYPNLILWICGHVHNNNIIAQPSPYPDRPEYGFWEVETASLRDFPQEFRTWEILRNTDNSISIRVTDIDPEETTNSPAAVSRGYAVGAARIFMTPCTSVTDTNSYAHNAELLKLLTPPMQAMIAGYGGPLGHKLAMDRIGTGVVINFLGELQSADTLLGPWSDVTDTSPYAVSTTNGVKFYRACGSDSSNATPKATDYSKPEHWLAVPATNMPVDIFYLYPTVWTSTNSNPEVCAIDNPSMLANAPVAFASQATAFETIGNIYAPFYRQANLTSNSLSIEAGIPTLDAVAAFDYYIQHYNRGRPFILAGHSQGANVLRNLLAEYMKDHPDVYARMIAAYVIGFPVTAEYLAANPHFKFAESADDTGVIISYNTQAPDVLPGANPILFGMVGMVINPLIWTRAETLATTNQGFGSFMPNTNGVYVRVPQYADARIDISNGVLICSSADEGTIGTHGIYHEFDYPFYYFNIRSNAANRVTKFLGSSWLPSNKLDFNRRQP